MPNELSQWDQAYLSGRDYAVFSDILLEQLFDKYHFTGTALDIGCGIGDLASRLSRHGLDVEGIDISSVAIQKARQLHKGISYRVADVFKH